MKIRNFAEIGVWAAATLIAVTAVFGVRPVESQNPVLKMVEPEAVVDGVRIRASVKPSAEPYKVILTISVENTGAKLQKIEPQFVITRNDFTGSPLARVISVNDTKQTVEKTLKLSLDVPPSRTITRTEVVTIEARPAEVKKDKPLEVFTLPPTYSVTLEGQKDSPPLAQFSASIAFPKQ